MKDAYIMETLKTCLLAAGTAVILSILGITEEITTLLFGIVLIINTLYLIVMGLAMIHISKMSLPAAVKLTESMKRDISLDIKRNDTWFTTVLLGLVALGYAIFGVSHFMLLTITLIASICWWKYFIQVGKYHEEFTEISNNN